MATQSLGISVAVHGLARFSRDIIFLNKAVYSYQTQVKRLEKAVMASSKAQVAASQRMVDSAVKGADRTYASYQKIAEAAMNYYTQNKKQIDGYMQAERALAGYTAALAVLKAKQNQTSSDKALIKSTEKDIKKSTREMEKYANVFNRYQSIVQKTMQAERAWINNKGILGQALKQTNAAMSLSIQKQQQLANATRGLSGWWNTLNGTVGKTFFPNDKMKQMEVQQSAVQIGTQTLAAAFGALGSAVGIVISVFKIFTGILKGLFGVGKFVVTKVLAPIAKAVWSLAKLPFNIIRGGFKSIQRVFEIMLGMNFDRVLWQIGMKFRDLAKNILDAAASFQLIEVQMQGLIARELVNASDGTTTFAQGLARSVPIVKELFNWVTEVAILSPFSVEDVNNTLKLASSYGITSERAKGLTQAIVDFGSGMGLTGDATKRIIENLGQMKMAGKITGTELRDLARGSFVPINDILEKMGEKFGKTPAQIRELGRVGKELGTPLELTTEQVEGLAKELEGLPVEEFIQAFEEYVGEEFVNAGERASMTWVTAMSNVNDFIESVLGMRVIKPILDKLSVPIVKLLANFMKPEILARFDKLGVALGGVAEKFLNMAGIDSKRSVEWMIDKVDTLIGGLKFFTSGQSADEFFGEFKDNPIYKIAKGLESIYNTVAKLKPIMQKIFSGDIAGGMADAFKLLQDTIFDKVIPNIKLKWDNFVDSLPETGEKIKIFFMNLGADISAGIAGLLPEGALKNVFSDLSALLGGEKDPTSGAKSFHWGDTEKTGLLDNLNESLLKLAQEGLAIITTKMEEFGIGGGKLTKFFEDAQTWDVEEASAQIQILIDTFKDIGQAITNIWDLGAGLFYLAQAKALIVSTTLDVLGFDVKFLDTFASQEFTDSVGKFKDNAKLFRDTLRDLQEEPTTIAINTGLETAIGGAQKGGLMPLLDGIFDNLPEKLGTLKTTMADAKASVGDSSTELGGFMDVLGDKTLTVQEKFRILFDNLVGNSIVPDGMQAIYDSMTGTMDTLTAQLEIQLPALSAVFGTWMDEIFLVIQKPLASLAYMYQLIMNIQAAMGGGFGSGGGKGDGLVEGFEWKANGGTVSAGSSYIVGEKGAELFIPKNSGTIIPHNQMLSTLKYISATMLSPQYSYSRVSNQEIMSNRFYGPQYFNMSQGVSLNEIFGATI